jgi:hypothetical protein
LQPDERNSYYISNSHLIYSNFPSISIFRNWIFIFQYLHYNLYRLRWNNQLWIIVCTCKATFNFYFLHNQISKATPFPPLFSNVIAHMCKKKFVHCWYNSFTSSVISHQFVIIQKGVSYWHQDQNIHLHRKNKPRNENSLQRAIIIRIFIIKVSNCKHEGYTFT